MDKNFIQYIRVSCCEALEHDKEYMKLQSDLVLAEKMGDKDSREEIVFEMECRAEDVCFMTGFNAAMNLTLKGVSL